MTSRIAAALCGALLVLGSCATPRGGRSGEIPAWVTTTPAPTAEYTYFVGSGSDANLAAANENAVHSLIADVTRYLGVRIDASTSVETRADLESFQTRISESIREASSARVVDFSIADRWVRSGGGQVTVFLLGRYRTGALAAEKERLAALEREREEAVALPEGRGDELIARGEAYGAAIAYMQAALAAATSPLDNATLKFERTVKKAEGAVSSIRLTPLAGRLEGRLGQPLPEPFRILALSTAGGAETRLCGAPFRVAYPVPRSGGKQATAQMRLTTDASGILTVALPPPELLGPQSVTAALDLSTQLEPLLRLPAPQRGVVEPLAQQIASLSVVLHYATTSQAASIPTGVLVADLDRTGVLMPESTTAAGIIGALAQGGYNLLPIAPGPSVPGAAEAELVKTLRDGYAGRIERAILGEARISQFEQADAGFIVKVSGSVAVADLATGRILFSTSMVKLARANGAASAIQAAFRELGTSIGEEIRNRLY